MWLEVLLKRLGHVTVWKVILWIFKKVALIAGIILAALALGLLVPG